MVVNRHPYVGLKRRRKVKQPFDQGANPSSRRCKAHQRKLHLAHCTHEHFRLNALPYTLVTAPLRFQSPVFREDVRVMT